MALGNALAEWQQALKVEGVGERVTAMLAAGSVMAEAIEDHIVSDAIRAGRAVTAKRPYPPNTKCVCGDLIHPDMPTVEVEADGGLFHWNEDGGGHRFDFNLT